MPGAADALGHKEKEDIVFRDALAKGTRLGITTFVASSGLSMLGHMYWPAYRRGLGVSGKLAIPLMAGIAAFTIRTENILVQYRHEGTNETLAHMDEDRVLRHKASMTSQQNQGPKLHHQLANWVYDNPFKAVAGVGIPLVAGIFYGQTQTKGLQQQQRIMHTRVYGQMSVIALLLGSMAFHDWMDKRGKFE